MRNTRVFSGASRWYQRLLSWKRGEGGYFKVVSTYILEVVAPSSITWKGKDASGRYI